MNKTIIYAMFMLLLVSAVSAQTMVREMPSSVNPGQSFTVRYQSQATTGNFGVLIDDSISGGCTPASITTGFLSPATYSELTITAPASGTCAFAGTYQFADTSGVQPEKNFASQSVTVASATTGSGSCVTSTWSPSRSTQCSGESFTQTSNCGATRTTTGTKTCGTGGSSDNGDSGSGGIFIIVAILIVLFIIFTKSIIK